MEARCQKTPAGYPWLVVYAVLKTSRNDRRHVTQRGDKLNLSRRSSIKGLSAILGLIDWQPHIPLGELIYLWAGWWVWVSVDHFLWQPGNYSPPFSNSNKHLDSIQPYGKSAHSNIGHGQRLQLWFSTQWEHVEFLYFNTFWLEEGVISSWIGPSRKKCFCKSHPLRHKEASLINKWKRTIEASHSSSIYNKEIYAVHKKQNIQLLDILEHYREYIIALTNMLIILPLNKSKVLNVANNFSP